MLVNLRIFIKNGGEFNARIVSQLSIKPTTNEGRLLQPPVIRQSKFPTCSILISSTRIGLHREKVVKQKNKRSLGLTLAPPLSVSRDLLSISSREHKLTRREYEINSKTGSSSRYNRNQLLLAASGGGNSKTKKNDSFS